MRSHDELPSSPANQPPRPQDPDSLSVFEQHRGLLFSIAYRMLGSVADGQDMVQESFLRWRQASLDEIHSPRPFLVTVITRLSINHLQSARLRREEYFGHWLPEPLVSDHDEGPLTAFAIDETLSLAFLVLLERLTPMERAVFLLREVFDYEYSEISRILNQNEANCRQILRRARKHVAEGRPRFSASHAERQQLLQRFLEATSRGDMDALIDLLSSDVVLDSDGGGKAPAVPNLIHGVDKVSRAILGSLQRLVPRDLVTRTAMVNGQPGIVSYRRGQPYSVITLDVHQGHIRTIFVLTNPHKLAHLAPLPSAPC